ncbi:MAG TPA: hypothetical protein VKZ53_17225 [Candidatus Angelobacter sp.]|nr:hypothetical protein [Candidatus Angelobacter sp.]
MAQKRKSDFLIYYVTVTYRSVLLGLLIVFLLAGIVTYFAFPGTANRLLQASANLMDRALVKAGLASNPSANGSVIEPGPQQAHFTNIDGAVKVKKRATNSWVSADYNVTLETGDVIQTSSEGIAKVVFTDGTNYTVKPDSLIVVQENSINSNQQTNVAVQVTTGTVDLATSSVGQGSKSQVIVAGATANLSSDTQAEVLSDPRHDEHEILLKKGAGEVTRNGETVKLATLDKVAFTADAPDMVKTKELGPPVLIEPSNMQSVAMEPGTAGNPVTFAWTPVDGIKRYRLKISRNPYFSSMVLEQSTESTQVQVTALKEGSYYWAVQSIAENGGRDSVDSEKNKFTLIPKAAESSKIVLELEPLVQHGHVLEVQGRTEAGAQVMVNGQGVPVFADGTFHHFTPALQPGMNTITVTVQNAKGGANTKQERILIQ